MINAYLATNPFYVRDSILSASKNIISGRKDVMQLASFQRAKFEGWFKFELACYLSKNTDFANLFLEEKYSANKFSDISFDHQGARWFVELKTSNTNWRASGLLNITRPITLNITQVISDIQSLQGLADSLHGLMVFVMFPIPLRIWEGDKTLLNNQVQRIERETNLTSGELGNSCDYTPIAHNFGVCTYVILVK